VVTYIGADAKLHRVRYGIRAVDGALFAGWANGRAGWRLADDPRGFRWYFYEETAAKEAAGLGGEVVELHRLR
jgi:hypothetical protein